MVWSRRRLLVSCGACGLGSLVSRGAAAAEDVASRNAAVLAYHRDNLRWWLNRGLDGFRFDAVCHLVENGPTQCNNQPQNYPIMRDVKALVDGYARRWLVCESPEDAAGFTAACSTKKVRPSTVARLCLRASRISRVLGGLKVMSHAKSPAGRASTLIGSVALPS